MHIFIYIAGTIDSVLIKGVSSFQRQFYAHLYLAGTIDSVLIKGVSSFQRQFYAHLFLAGTIDSILIKGVVMQFMGPCLCTCNNHAIVHRVDSVPCVNVIVYADEKSELGMEELMAEAYTLKAIHDKVCQLARKGQDT